MTETTETASIWDLMGAYLPGGRLDQSVAHLVPPNDNGDREWTLVDDEARRQPEFMKLVDDIAAGRWPHPVRARFGRLDDASTRLVCAAAAAGVTAGIPVLKEQNDA